MVVLVALLHSASSEDPFPTNVKRAVACDTFFAELECPANHVVIVQGAFFGRTENRYCDYGPRHNMNCNLGDQALKISAERCNNRRSCRLVSTHFPDPCHGTLKYLVVDYTCRALASVVACDDEVLKVQCPKGKFIIVHDAFFGRTSNAYCARGPRSDYKCSMEDFKRIAAQRCNNKESCEFRSNSVPVDPCPGTFKYMTVGYGCVDHPTTLLCHADGQQKKNCPSGPWCFFGEDCCACELVPLN